MRRPQPPIADPVFHCGSDRQRIVCRGFLPGNRRGIFAIAQCEYPLRYAVDICRGNQFALFGAEYAFGIAVGIVKIVHPIAQIAAAVAVIIAECGRRDYFFRHKQGAAVARAHNLPTQRFKLEVIVRSLSDYGVVGERISAIRSGFHPAVETTVASGEVAVAVHAARVDCHTLRGDGLRIGTEQQISALFVGLAVRVDAQIRHSSRDHGIIAPLCIQRDVAEGESEFRDLVDILGIGVPAEELSAVAPHDD